MLCFFLLLYYLPITACSDLLSRQKRAWIIDSFSIEEGHRGPFPYELGKIKIERPYRVYFDLFGEGVDKEPNGLLFIDKRTGIVYVTRSVDYEEIKLLKLSFEATKIDTTIDTKLGVEISILDINDNPPCFEKSLYEIEVKEEDPQGSPVLTLVAFDRDKPGTLNSTFHYEIKSVTPNTPNTEFFIDKSGNISFKGCLNHEEAKKFEIVVEAKDHGEVVKLSNSTTVVIKVQDGNNNLPVISGQTGTSKVVENESGSSPLRLHVTDKDSPHTPAWRARYTIHGDEKGHFKIETDPDTNDGILTVVKALDYEDGAKRELSISVENEMTFFSCKVLSKTSSGLWTVDNSIRNSEGQSQSVKVVIEVEDVNDPPMFDVIVKEATLKENTAIGTMITNVTAVDPDTTHSSDFEYLVGDDPEGWVKVDKKTGVITTAKIPDRENEHVVNGIYTVILHAVDKGKPPMTGTATLQIYVIDVNDNVPEPVTFNLSMCLSGGPTTANITATDKDDSHSGGPFRFILMGDVKEKWTLDPSDGSTAGLVRGPSVYAGLHIVQVGIFDTQGQSGVYNLSVTVCNCSVNVNCSITQDTSIQFGSGAIAALLALLILLLLLLLMAFFCTTKKEFVAFEATSNGESLLLSNTEKPGTDCQVPERIVALSSDQRQDVAQSNCLRSGSLYNGMQSTAFSPMGAGQYFMDQQFSRQPSRRGSGAVFSTGIYKQVSGQNFMDQQFSRGTSRRGSEDLVSPVHNQLVAGQISQLSRGNSRRGNRPVLSAENQSRALSAINSLFKQNQSYTWGATLGPLIDQKVVTLYQEDDDVNDQLHVYAEEGDMDNCSELDKISIADDDSFERTINDLGPRFNDLASMCQPPRTQN